jgi:hypothetical protein
LHAWLSVLVKVVVVATTRNDAEAEELRSIEKNKILIICFSSQMRFSEFSPKDAIEIALRVLAAWTSWREPVREDLVTLKRAFPEWNHLADDELACHVITTSLCRVVNIEADADERRDVHEAA